MLEAFPISGDNREVKHVSSMFLTLVVLFIVGSGCTSAYRKSVGGEIQQVYSRYYLTDFNLAWQAALESLKSTRLDVSNREAGLVQTKWMENTNEKNFVDSFGNADSYLKAQYRVKVTVARGVYKSKPAVRVTVMKEQLVQRDVLEGWKSTETDGIDEGTLLYRIGRIVHIKMKLGKMEEEKTKQELENVKF